MSSISDTPICDDIPLEEDMWLSSDETCYERLHQISTTIVQSFTDINIVLDSVDNTDDHVLAYSKEVLSLELLYLEFSDAIREGDGLRILRCYRYFLPLFRASKHKNYSIEASLC